MYVWRPVIRTYCLPPNHTDKKKQRTPVISVDRHCEETVREREEEVNGGRSSGRGGSVTVERAQSRRNIE